MQNQLLAKLKNDQKVEIYNWALFILYENAGGTVKYLKLSNEQKWQANQTITIYRDEGALVGW